MTGCAQRLGNHATGLAAAALVVCLGAVAWPAPVAAQTARELYSTALGRDQQVRELLEQTSDAVPAATRAQLLRQAADVLNAYNTVVRRYPTSGYSDNALFNAGMLRQLLHRRFGRPEDRTAALRLYGLVISEYPASSLVGQARARLAELEQRRPAAPAATDPPAPRAARGASELSTLTAIERTALPDGVRITLRLDREVPYDEQQLSGPSRLFFDLKGVRAAPDLQDAVLRYTSEPVRQIRIGRHPDNTIRVVLDLEDVAKYSVFTLYNPFRLVIDCEPAAAHQAAGAIRAVAPHTLVEAAALGKTTAAPAPGPAVSTMPAREDTGRAADNASPERPAASVGTPAAPSAPNASGGFSLSRQLGLGVTRVVIDAGHGGHDPGAQVRGLSEAEVTLDIALRLEQLLLKDGVEVVLTRRTDVYIPLEERTAIANREQADLFLSIHANASRNTAARGIETYYLSFASSPEAEAVAARENSANAGTMRALPDIVKAITLNNKLDESRDLAGMVQEALVTRLRRMNQEVRNLGVKKAPFVVLIGAGMPSVLAEVSFLTNRQEAQLLRTPAYRERIAEALHAAVMRYRRTLKGQQVAEKDW